jgi:uncharacterized protein
MPSPRRIPLPQARRIALDAQGLSRRRPVRRVDLRQLTSVFHRLGVLQIDSVNVLTRAHHLPFFSRLGSYDRDRLDRWLWHGKDTFEYHAHEAALIAVDQHRLMRHRMDHMRRRYPLEGAAARFAEAVRDEIAERGPLAATDLADGGSRTGPWWGRSRGKRAVAHLHRVGDLSVAHRRTNFETVYDLPGRVLPEMALTVERASDHEAHRELLLVASRAHGIGTAADLADYHRLKAAPSKAALTELVAEGRVEMVAVDGWDQPAYLHPEAVVPRRADAQALLSPFDPVVWFRPRLERLFGFHYRIEIYVPEPKRVYGYYVLPFLLGDEMVARVDLKADRKSGVLRVRGAFAEPGRATAAVAGPLAEELAAMAGWLGLGEVDVADNGDLATPLRLALPPVG